MRNRKAVILYGRVPRDAPPDEQDVLTEAAVVSEALSGLGWDVCELALDLDLRTAATSLRELAPAFVFNLVETLEGRGRYIHLAPTLLESLGIPYTGAPLEAMFTTSSKTAAKRVLELSGIRSPPGMAASEALRREPSFPPPWILKNSWEHASVGLEDTSVTSDPAALRAEIRRRGKREGIGDLFLESFVEGREFNLSLLAAGADGPRLLPPAEIEFIGFAKDKPRMVGYRAKWIESAPEFIRTPRRFDFPATETALLAELERVARSCWRLFGLRGWARIDFRVDRAGTPWVLEVNANPCLSPDAGFAAAAAQAGLPLSDVIAAIVRDRVGKESP